MKLGTRGTVRRVEPRRGSSSIAGAVFAISCAIALAACGGPGGSPRPTDPRLILTNAISATAALPALRLHLEIAVNAGALTGQANGVMKMAMDADVDLANRQFASRSTTQVPPDVGGNGVAQQQISDTITTQTTTFNRDSRTGRWSKFPSGFGGGPTNAEIATMITNLLSNPSVTFELKDAGSCTLGTCDHVLAHIDGQAISQALGPLIGAPGGAGALSMIPSFDVDVLVDQATSVISELRAQISMAGTSEQVLLTVSNPGQPVQINPPPPGLVDDLRVNLGGGVTIGPMESGILEEVGNELKSLNPDEPLPSTP